MAFRKTIPKEQVNPTQFRGIQHFPRGVPFGDKGMNGRSIPSLPDVIEHTYYVIDVTVCQSFKKSTGEPCKAKPIRGTSLCVGHTRKKVANE